MTAQPLNLPPELIDFIAQHLINNFAFASCASVNVLSRAVHKTTLKILWTTMFWIPYQDGASYDKDDIERKWKVFKRSNGMKHVKFMIEPGLYKSVTGYTERPIISKSLSKSLKASIALDPHGESPSIQVHLFKAYGYHCIDLTQVQDALNLTKGLSAFASITEIYVYVRAKPVNRTKVFSSDEDNEVATSTDLESKIIGDGSQQQTSDAVRDANTGWLSSIYLDISKSARLDENNHFTCISHIIKLLQPYSERQVQDDSLGEPACLKMSAWKVSTALSFASAIIKIYDNSGVSAMIDYDLHLAYDYVTGKPLPTPSQISEMQGVLHQARNKIIQASKAVSLRMLGRFHISNNPQSVFIDIKVEAKRKVLETHFEYGFGAMVREEMELADVKDVEA